MTQCCILKRTRGSPVSQSYLYATCQGNSQMNELARNLLFKRDILRIWSQENTHNCIRGLAQRTLLAGEKLSDIISPSAAKKGLSPLPEKSLPSKFGVQHLPTNGYCSNVICAIAVCETRLQKMLKTGSWPVVPWVNSNKYK